VLVSGRLFCMAGEAAAWLACQYLDLHNLFLKNNTQVVYMHTRLTFSSILKGFLNDRVSYLIGSNQLEFG
jgi:hypothetical protein